MDALCIAQVVYLVYSWKGESKTQSSWLFTGIFLIKEIENKTQFVVGEAVIESIVGCGLSSRDPLPVYEARKLYYFSQYQAIFNRFQECKYNKEYTYDPSQIQNLDPTFKVSF